MGLDEVHSRRQMKPIRLVPFGNVELALLERLRIPLASEYQTSCSIDFRSIDPSVAFHPERQQYHSTEMLQALAAVPHEGSVLLGVAAVDLYIPILTFVFGEARVAGCCAVISTYRLRQSFYGLPPDEHLEFERLLKEAVHELGHTMGLHHCDDYGCVMASSPGVERIDLKGWNLCGICRLASIAS
jgi:archaemetzincin